MRIIKAKEKKERSLGAQLGLKPFRSNSPKSAFLRRPQRPGVHGAKRPRSASEFKAQLMEKQRMKVSYGLSERQMKSMVTSALKSKRSVPEFIIDTLESRLDNVVMRLGLAPSRIMARQMVTHGHILVNGIKMTIPSYAVKKGNVITIKESKKSSPLYKELPQTIKAYTPPSWLSLNKETLEGTIVNKPENVELPFNMSLVIDYYSR